MFGELLAVATSILRGLSMIPTKKGLQHSNPITSAISTIMINLLLLWVMTFILYPLDQLSFNGFEYFVIAGILAPGIARIFRDISLSRVGVTITIPILSIGSFLSMLIATIFLNEEITVYLAVGAIFIFFGINILTWQSGVKVKWRKKDLVFSIGAAFFFAFSTNLRKIGLKKIVYPVFGAAITSTVSFVVMLISLFFMSVKSSGSWSLELNKNALKYFSISGFASGLAFTFYFLALSASYVTTIQPITATTPLFSMLFSFLFLKDVERITRNIVWGTILIVFGIGLIFI